jgi:hypothetical protein
MYAPFGVVERSGARLLPPNDKGRIAVTKTVSDQYVFRVPPLRNVELTPPSTPVRCGIHLDRRHHGHLPGWQVAQ